MNLVVPGSQVGKRVEEFHTLLQMREDLQRGAGDVNMVEIVWTDPSWLEWDFFIQTQRH